MCRGCTDPQAGMDRTSMDIGDGGNLELVDKFYYLSDILSVDTDAVEVRVRKRQNKFRHLMPLATNMDVSLLMRGKLYRSCLQSCMLHGSETWPVKAENRLALQQADISDWLDM